MMKSELKPLLNVLKARFMALPRWGQALVVIITLVFVSQVFFGGSPPPSPKAAERVKIVATPMQAEPHRRSIVMYGATQPVRDVSLNAQAQGEVVLVPSKEGARLRKGDVILQVDARARPQQLQEAKALLRQREIEYEAARKLQKQGFESNIRLAQSKAQLDQARANLKQFQLESDFLKLTAPFDGLLEEINVDEGDFVGIGTFGVEGAAARLVDLDPLLVVARLSETDRAEVRIGDEASARLAGGERVTGYVSNVGHVADPQSRTFLIEVEVPNGDYTLPVGVTAELEVKGREQMSYPVSASVLALNDAGEVGIKRLDDERRVVFESIEIIEEHQGQLWISNLPDEIQLISTGQAYVSDAQQIPEDAIEVAK